VAHIYARLAGALEAVLRAVLEEIGEAR